MQGGTYLGKARHRRVLQRLAQCVPAYARAVDLLPELPALFAERPKHYGQERAWVDGVRDWLVPKAPTAGS